MLMSPRNMKHYSQYFLDIMILCTIVATIVATTTIIVLVGGTTYRY